MPLLICDQHLADDLIVKRQACGGDRYDEVWDGVYIISPARNIEDQSLASEIGAIIKTQVDWNDRGLTLVGANVSNDDQDWTKNYRVPDILVFKKNTLAINRSTHWLGGPELTIEIVSKGDKTLEKLGFYASVGTEELLVVDRHPWCLTLYRRTSTTEMKIDSTSDLTNSNSIASTVFPLQFRLSSVTTSIEVLDETGKLIRAIPIQV
jgi:Uma2 family endonuclease